MQYWKYDNLKTKSIRAHFNLFFLGCLDVLNDYEYTYDIIILNLIIEFNYFTFCLSLSKLLD